ncbi:MAG: HWE histidine kinase domain-containing protein [Pseudomonadota bacterium]
MAPRVRGFDWGATPLGPADAWPDELKAAVGQILDSRFPAAIVWGEGLTTIYNDAFLPILGRKPEALGRSFADVWSEVWDQIGPIASRAYAGEATYIEDFQLEIERSNRRELAWFTFCYSPLRLADGAVAGMMDTVVETTASVKARRELEVLNNELRHRLKNTLTTVQSIIWQTLRRQGDPTLLDALTERIVALGAAHDVLFTQGWTGAHVEDVLDAALQALASRDRIELDGPRVPVGARGAVSLALVTHELATNAVKYGALSGEAGRVRLGWSSDGETLKLTWREAGGPPVAEPGALGFGSRLIDMGLSDRGVVRRRYPAGGFEADLSAPLADLMGE